MAKLPLEILADADAEALAAATWYRVRSPKAALGFAREIGSMLEHIRESPEAWPEYDHGTRRALLERFPYEVIYRLLPDRILIVAIAHCKRRPGYWRTR